MEEFEEFYLATKDRVYRTVLAAASNDQPALEGYHCHGVFTYAVLDALGAADVNGDGTEDFITGAGVGGAPLVVVFDGVTQTVLRIFYAYDPAFRGGVNVAAADVTGDGVPDAESVDELNVRAQSRCLLARDSQLVGGRAEQRRGDEVAAAVGQRGAQHQPDALQAPTLQRRHRLRSRGAALRLGAGKVTKVDCVRTLYSPFPR